MAIKIVDFPINSIVIFHSYVTVYHSLPEGRSGYLIGFDSNLWTMCDLPGSTVSKMIEFFFLAG